MIFRGIAREAQEMKRAVVIDRGRVSTKAALALFYLGLEVIIVEILPILLGWVRKLRRFLSPCWKKELRFC